MVINLLMLTFYTLEKQIGFTIHCYLHCTGLVLFGYRSGGRYSLLPLSWMSVKYLIIPPCLGSLPPYGDDLERSAIGFASLEFEPISLAFISELKLTDYRFHSFPFPFLFLVFENHFVELSQVS
jgi:hypothetical protein